jgi:electron transport complex protein RnfC
MEVPPAFLALRARLGRQAPGGPDPLLLYGEGSFLGGVHPPQHKEAAALPIRRLPFAPRVVVHLSQHIGKPALAAVVRGQEVVRGEPIARADGFVSVPMHAPVAGVVEAVEPRPNARGQWSPAVVIRTFEASTQAVQWAAPRDAEALSPAEIVAATQDAGMVGLGGAAFPTHVKLVPPKGAAIHTLIVNGCECEPYLTCDHRIMLERAAELVAGARLAMRAAGARRVLVGIEDNKPDALAAVRAALPPDGSIEARPVQAKYPQGSEKMLIRALLGQELPVGALPSALGVVVNNVGTLSQLGRLLPAGEGLVERVITVAGTAVRRPGNYLVPVGTPLRFLLEQAGVRDEALEVVLGGPMMGQAVAEIDVPVAKGVSGVLAFRARDLAPAQGRRVFPCIKCGECVASCPMGLNPSLLGMLAARREYDAMAAHHLNACFECGSCSYVCPANLPLVQRFRVAKQVLRERAA